MAQSFPETYSPDPKKMAAGWTHVFDRKNCTCEQCKPEPEKPEEKEE